MCNSFSTFKELMTCGAYIINTYLISIVYFLSLICFIWGMIVFIKNAGSEEDRKKGKKLMLWGVVIFAVMTSVWSLVYMLSSIFGAGIIIPQLKVALLMEGLV
jgi:hypothetical protein